MSAPEQVFAVKTPLGEFVLVKKGIVGYWPTTPGLAERLIAEQGPAVTESALSASMFGWDIPAARVALAAPGLAVQS